MPNDGAYEIILAQGKDFQLDIKFLSSLTHKILSTRSDTLKQKPFYPRNVSQ